MKKPLFLQSYGTDPDYTAMVDLFRPLHERYCSRHNYTYLSDDKWHGEVADFAWSKLFRFRHYLRENKYSHIFWIDADAFLNPNSLDVDMRDAVNDEKWLGMVRHNGSWNGCWPWHYNTGVMYVRCCPEAQTFFEEACDWFYQPRSWQDNNEQTAIMDLIMNSPMDYYARVNNLHHSWNANYNYDQWNPDSTIIMAFHGAGYRDSVDEARMKEVYGDPLPCSARLLCIKEFMLNQGIII